VRTESRLKLQDFYDRCIQKRHLRELERGASKRPSSVRTVEAKAYSYKSQRPSGMEAYVVF